MDYMNSCSLNKKDVDTIRIVFFGEPGTGKSETCDNILETFEEEEYFLPDHNSSDISPSLWKRYEFKHSNGDNETIIDIIECPAPIMGWTKENYLNRIIEPLDRIFKMGITAIIFTNCFKFPQWRFNTTMTAYRFFNYIIPKSLLDRCVILTTCEKDMININEQKEFYLKTCIELNKVLNNTKDENSIKNIYKFHVYPIENFDQNDTKKSIIKLMEKLNKKWKYLKKAEIKHLDEYPKNPIEDYVGPVFREACMHYQRLKS